ncbi:AAA family ATPase [Agrobacterium tumefaciens]|uniref:AAA family ATPase n=1 Tax=Agrobacterium tumefaciens TaxID=358 RepID=UPI003857BBCF
MQLWRRSQCYKFRCSLRWRKADAQLHLLQCFLHRHRIFIDEPELSLHVDWQRQLFPLLLSQQQSNQFIIATHSPFIYSKYPDREVVVDPDRGDDEGDLR